MKKNYLIICFLFALFLGLGAKDMAVSAATRKVIVEQPTEQFELRTGFFPREQGRESVRGARKRLQFCVDERCND